MFMISGFNFYNFLYDSRIALGQQQKKIQNNCGYHIKLLLSLIITYARYVLNRCEKWSLDSLSPLTKREVLSKYKISNW